MINPDDYMLVPEAARKWGISCGRVNNLLWDGRIKGAMKIGRQWIIPKDAEKPLDRRFAIKNLAQKNKSLEGIRICPTCGGRLIDTEELITVEEFNRLKNTNQSK